MADEATGSSWPVDHSRLALANVVPQRQAFRYAGLVSSFDQPRRDQAH